MVATATYTLTDRGELKEVMEATTDKSCPVNLCNHSYFNLAGHDSGDILEHRLHLNAFYFTPGARCCIGTASEQSQRRRDFKDEQARV